MDNVVIDPALQQAHHAQETPVQETPAQPEVDPREYFNPANVEPSMEGMTLLRNAGHDAVQIANWISTETGIPGYPITAPHPTRDILEYMNEVGKNHPFGSRRELPWIPLCMIGTIPVLGHFHPFARDFYGFRPDLIFTVIISADDYALIAPNLTEHFPIETAPNTPLQPPTPHGQTTSVALLEWMRSENWISKTFHQGTSAEVVLKENPQHEWVLEMLVQGKRVIPYDNISLTERNLAALPQAMMEKYQMVCYHRVDETYYIASSNPNLSRTRLTGELNARIGARTEGASIGVVCGMAYSAFIEGAIRYLMTGGISAEKASVVGDVQKQENTDTFRIDYDPAFARPLDESMEPPEVLRWILFRAISMKSSDIHIQECEEVGEIRLRVNGALALVATTNLEYIRKVISLIKLSADLNVAEKRMPQDGRFSIELKTETVDARVSTIPLMTTTAGESCVIRLINKQSSLKSITELDIPPRQMGIIRSALEKKSGLVLVTGPTGSGKTSTLYACLNEVNTVDVAIVTIEDPVEITLHRAKQLQVNTTIGLTFSKLLRSVLRHDPDIVMVGEIRDKETADHAIQAAQTGHLVFATLHTNDALRAIPRLEALGTDRNQLANSLLMVQAQRLVRTLCKNCRKPRHINQREHETVLRHLPQDGGRGPEYQAFIEEWNDMIDRAVNGINPVYDPGGCIHCNQTGYSKRRVVMEVYPIDDQIRDMIENGSKVGAVSQYVRKQGHTDLAMESLRLFLQGETSFDEIKGFMKI